MSIKNLMVLSWMILLIIPSVYSLGLTSPFFGNSITMYPGETKTVTFILQNMVGEKDLDVSVELTQGKDIAHLTTPQNFILPYGRNDIPISVEISIPSYTQTSSDVAFSIKTLNPKSLKTLQIVAGLEKRFTVELTERPAVVEEQPQPAPIPPLVPEQPPAIPPDTQVVLLALVVAVASIILYRIVRKHKQKYELKRVKDALK